MIQVSRVKRLLAVGLAVAATIALAVTLLGSGVVVFSSQSGADPAEAFLKIPLVPERLDELVDWMPDQELVRPVEPTTRALIESTLVRGWQRVDTAERSGDRDLIDTWFMPLLAPHVAQDEPGAPASSVRQLGHQIEVMFYSLDGSVLAANVTSSLERQIEGGPSLGSTDRFEVVFLLSDGNWRIQHLTLVEAER